VTSKELEGDELLIPIQDPNDRIPTAPLVADRLADVTVPRLANGVEILEDVNVLILPNVE
jgi:hypothetical protein